jgi:hypothetical protein
MYLKFIYLVLVFFYGSSMNAASEKQLDNFSASTFGYYYISGVTASVSSSQSYEGGSSLQVSYMLSPGSYGEIFRSYGTNTLDLSFFPQSLSIQIKGQATQYPQFRFMLYEDNDMDGNPFEAGEDIFEFVDNTILSNTSWSYLNMTYTSFTKFGGGVGSLALNRIYAWRIYLLNTGATSISGTVYFDDLKQHTSYTPPTSGTGKINGAFLQLWNDATCGACGTWTTAQWLQQFQYMKDVCIDKIIIQYGVWNTVAWYHPSSLSGVTSYNTINNIFAAANSANMHVYVGLYFDAEFDAASASNSTYYNSLYTKNTVVIDDLWSLFGSNPSFEGWYIPQEIHDLYWQNATDLNLLSNWIQNVAAYAKSKNISKKVMIAPYFGPWKPADIVENWYNNFLAIATNLDIVALQDGAGTHANWGMGPPINKDIDVDVPAYYTAVKNACTNHSKTFAADVESFSDPDPRTPATIDRLKSQLWEAEKHTSEIYQFAWLYMQPALSSATQQLYNDYLNYTSCIPMSLNTDKNKPLTYETIHNFGIKKIDDKIFEVPDDFSEVSVFDYLGRPTQVTTDQKRIFFAHHSKGLFFTVVKTQNGTHTYKIFVN